MKPLDIAQYTNDWDVIIPYPETGSVKPVMERMNNAERSIFPGAVVIAITGALLTNSILLAIALILALSACANFAYHSIQENKERTSTSSSSAIFRRDITESKQSSEIFMSALDSGEELHIIISSHTYMHNFVSDSSINAALWQCAFYLKHNEISRARKIVEDLEESVQLAQQASRNLNVNCNDTAAIESTSQNTISNVANTSISPILRALYEASNDVRDINEK